MGGSQARGTGPWACGTLLLLLLLSATTSLTLEGDPASQDSMHSQEVVGIKKNSLLTFLARWHSWTSPSSTGDLVGGATGQVAKRQDGAPLQQPPQRNKTRCKNFFWKTFSSCK